jgi:hypothetical protein
MLSLPEEKPDVRPGCPLQREGIVHQPRVVRPSERVVQTLQPKNPYIRIALRRAARGTGSSDTFLDRRTAVQQLPDLSQILGGVRWALVGAMALRAYAPERLTQDVDIVIHVGDEQAARVAFISAGYRIGGSLLIGGFTAHPAEGVGYSIDVLAFDEPWLNEALAQPMYDRAGFPVLARHFLILMKLQAGRAQDVADITRLLRRADQTERAVARATVATYAPDLLDDFDALVVLTDLEFGTGSSAAT